MPPARNTCRRCGKKKCSGYQHICTDCILKEVKLRARRAERERRTQR